ncbi:uncharacterized protein LOC123534332 [Mercenaria mercenaria]|uniref:uncharacterized protein LOC123534332 n=1 Tax=Mercenaria mercenaria TaxID=6596 RepID=UPI00234E76C1|nr:uncharacterized protein LOC123534332 [Mercenaria mercenaria]
MAGNDTKNRKAAKGFVKDITDVHEVITSKFPLVMGVRKEHVAIVRPEKPGNAEKFKGKNGQLDEAFKMLKEINNTQTLLIYFSGHYYGGKGFQLGSDEEFLSLEELQTKVLSCLSGVDYKSPTFPLSSKRLIVFLDCCSAPGMKVPRFEEKSCLSLVQLNACRPNQEAYGDAENGSKFTLFFKQGLTGRALGKQCYNIMEGKIKQCQECELSGDLVTLQDLNKYITRHLKPYETSYQTVIYYDNASDLDTKIGYAIQYSIGLRFTFKLGDDEKRNSIQQRMFTNMISLRTILSDKFIEVMQPGSSEEPPLETEGVRDILCIEIEHGPKYVHRDELDSLERVMGAWYAKRDLIVSLRRLSDIRNGKVGMFLPAGYSVKPIKEYLGQNECFQELGPNSEEDTVYSVKLESLSEIAVQEDNPSLEKFGSILVDLEDALSKEKEYKMLHIIFPGAHGKQRNDFICFQIVKQNEED